MGKLGERSNQKSLTTIEMELALLDYFEFNQKLVVPGVTSLSGLVAFETDMLVLSVSGYATAIEIKVSKADLKNDLKKAHILLKNSLGLKSPLEWYYEKIKGFYYAVPIELKEAALSQIPSYAGLLIVENHPSKKNRYLVKIVKKSTILFPFKWTQGMRYNLARIGAMRIYNLKKRIAMLLS